MNDAEVEVESEHSAPSSGDEYKAINLNTMLEHDSDQKFNANVGYLNQKKGQSKAPRTNRNGEVLDKPKTKERTVAYVIEKVAQWRRLYNGYYDQNFDHKRLSLEDAAEQVGVSKKSLDDYLSQLRSGRQCGYDFNMYKDQKVGHLRKFVKENLDEVPKNT